MNPKKEIEIHDFLGHRKRTRTAKPVAAKPVVEESPF
jgi:hypothetical protein